MRMIFEVVEGEDFIEIVLQRREAEALVEKGAVADIPWGISPRNLNLFVRVESPYEEDSQALELNPKKTRKA